MSGKYAKKKKSSHGGFILVLAVVLVLLAGFWVMGFLAQRNQEAMPLPTDLTEPAETGAPVATTLPAETTQPESEPPYTFEEEQTGVTSFNLGPGLDILRYGKYIGLYMEDGSDEFVENVMMIVVENTSEQAIQYAKITVSGPAGDAVFNLTTLLPGDSVVVLEENRKPYSEEDIYTDAAVENLALFQDALSNQEDRLLIQPLAGGFNITNISGEDITGEIAIYFKDVAADMFYGGITYVCRIEGGLKADEVRQIMSANFTEKGSKIVFITIAE